MTYTNGQIPTNQLVAISGHAGARLLSGPAASWERIVAACHDRYGWRPAPTGPSDAYRELAVQVATFLARYVPAKTGGGYYGDVRWWNGVRYVRKAGTSAAAVPGTSNHGRGRAVDVTGLGGFGGTRYRQFAAVAVPLGWSNDEGESVDEPWHWVDLLSPETVASGHATWPGAPSIADPTLTYTPIEPEDEDMKPHLLYHPNGTIAVLRPATGEMQILRTADEPGALEAAGLVDPEATVDLRPGRSTLVWDMVEGIAKRAGKYIA
ncbi:hypothetical protein [Cellulomonas hominis]|uniref:hypothetical protein n=1 Tax=Cellulomonas hominis TaxID=156981 RepID=UPI001443CC71|nr:hypothetical protein [Cellulomonas hominis]NKY08958.1 hypothetical protein [Cellulomonas hominis]